MPDTLATIPRKFVENYQPQTNGSHSVVPERVAAATTFLPPSFELIPRLLLLLDDPDADSEVLVNLIRVDAGLTADILHVANSALYSRGGRVETLIEAVNRVGSREIYQIITNIIVSPVLANSQQKGFARLDLWRHSLTTALAAQALATHASNADPEVAFTAALLHDIGKVVLAQAVGSDYIATIEEAKTSLTPVFKAEQSAFKTNHVEVGAKLLKHWNFAECITAAVAFHHAPENAGRLHGPLSAIVYAGNCLAYRIGSGYGFPSYTANPEVGPLRMIGITPAQLLDYEEDVRVALDREESRFREGIGGGDGQ